MKKVLKSNDLFSHYRETSDWGKAVDYTHYII